MRPSALVVATDERELAGLGRALEGAGFEARLVASTETARHWIAAEHPDLLVLDASVPRLAQFHLYSELRGADGNADTPILFARYEGGSTEGGGRDGYLPPMADAAAVGALAWDLLDRAGARSVGGVAPSTSAPIATTAAAPADADVDTGEATTSDPAASPRGREEASGELLAPTPSRAPLAEPEPPDAGPADSETRRVEVIRAGGRPTPTGPSAPPRPAAPLQADVPRPRDLDEDVVSMVPIADDTTPPAPALPRRAAEYEMTEDVVSPRARAGGRSWWKLLLTGGVALLLLGAAVALLRGNATPSAAPPATVGVVGTDGVAATPSAQPALPTAAASPAGTTLTSVVTPSAAFGVGAAGAAPGSTGVSGRVVDGRNNRAVDGASLRLTAVPGGSPEMVTTSDSEGRFEQPDLPPGSYQVTAIAPGFRPAVGNVAVSSGSVSTISLLLEPD